MAYKTMTVRSIYVTGQNGIEVSVYRSNQRHYRHYFLITNATKLRLERLANRNKVSCQMMDDWTSVHIRVDMD